MKNNKLHLKNITKKNNIKNYKGDSVSLSSPVTKAYGAPRVSPSSNCIAKTNQISQCIPYYTRKIKDMFFLVLEKKKHGELGTMWSDRRNPKNRINIPK